MTRETLQLMAALADERKIQSLQTQLERKIGRANVYESRDEQESFAYNILLLLYFSFEIFSLCNFSLISYTLFMNQEYNFF